jgi:hypothetical protein
MYSELNVPYMTSKFVAALLFVNTWMVYADIVGVFIIEPI